MSIRRILEMLEQNTFEFVIHFFYPAVVRNFIYMYIFVTCFFFLLCVYMCKCAYVLLLSWCTFHFDKAQIHAIVILRTVIYHEVDIHRLIEGFFFMSLILFAQIKCIRFEFQIKAEKGKNTHSAMEEDNEKKTGENFRTHYGLSLNYY